MARISSMNCPRSFLVVLVGTLFGSTIFSRPIGPGKQLDHIYSCAKTLNIRRSRTTLHGKAYQLARMTLLGPGRPRIRAITLPKRNDCVIRELLQQRANEGGDKAFLIFECDERWSYVEAFARGSAAAEELERRGIEQGDLVLSWQSWSCGRPVPVLCSPKDAHRTTASAR
jgi:hypothetical protein